MRNGGGLGRQVQLTRRFWQNWHKMPETLRKRAHAKIVLLQQNPAHPSLHVHQLHRMAVSVCSISLTHRVLFKRQADRIILLDIGTHRCVDRAHIHVREPRSRESRNGKRAERSKQERRSRSAYLPPSLRRKQHFHRKW